MSPAPMLLASAAMSRRTFLTATSLATVATAMPAAAAALVRQQPLALASHRSAVPADWTGTVVVLSGDYTQRLASVRRAVVSAAGGPLTLFLDGADSVLFDIAAIDTRLHLRPLVAAAAPVRLSAGAFA